LGNANFTNFNWDTSTCKLYLKNTFLIPSRGTSRQENKIFTNVIYIIEKVKSVGKCKLYKLEFGLLEHVNYTSKNTFLISSRGTPRQENKIFTDVVILRRITFHNLK